jgi:hypothetical protein
MSFHLRLAGSIQACKPTRFFLEICENFIHTLSGNHSTMRERLTKRHMMIWRFVRAFCALALIVAMIAPFPFMESVASAFTFVLLAVKHTVRSPHGPQEAPPQSPSHNSAPRLKVFTQNTREVVFGEPIASAIVIDPNIVTVEVKGDRSCLIKGLMVGTTILIISGKSSRITYAIDVERPPAVRRPRNNDERRVEQPGSSSGSISLYFTPGFNGGPALLRHSFEYQQKLANNRTLRMSGEMFRFFGGGERALTLPVGTSFGANRFTLGLDSPAARLDFMDSALEVSPLGFSGFLLRGPHFVSTPESRWRGLELFAGIASPQLKLFNQGEGRVAGAIMPIIQSKSWRVRAGFFFIAPLHKTAGPANVASQGGMVLHTDVRYTPDERTTVEGEAAYANGGLSWRARLDLRRGAFNFYGELSSLDRRSPMIAIGAQSGGHQTSAFNLQWQPTARFSAAVSYSRTTTVPLESSSRLQLNSTGFLVSTNFRPTRNINLGFSLNQQVINAPTSARAPFLLNLQTRTAVIKYDQRFNRQWANSTEVRLILSREANTDEQMSHGLILHEQLRYAWASGSITGFVNYRSNTPSLESLVLRNPALLPVEFRAAFAADPVRFLLTNRDALPLLLQGIELPLTRNTESGFRLQSAFSHLNITGEMLYSVGKFRASEQRTLFTSLSANLKLDAANSIQVSAGHTFSVGGIASQTSLTVGYVHRFGAGSGGGFQFSKLLGRDRGRIEGRVFFDLNSNGQDDANEPGIAGMKVQLDGNRSATTDVSGHFSLGSLEPGAFDVALISDDIGVKLRSSGATLQHVSLSARQTINLSFGLTNSGFVAGRVFNDLSLTGESTAGDAPGLSGVKFTLRPVVATADSRPLSQMADGNGLYEFRNLAPGKYLLGIDTATLPANFRLTAQTTWPITVSPLQGLYLDLPFAAQRAISGIIYLDRDGDGQYDPQKDVVVEGARIAAGNSQAVSNRQGLYLLRNLPAGRIEVHVSLSTGKGSGIVNIELGPDPILRNGVNLMVSE